MAKPVHAPIQSLDIALARNTGEKRGYQKLLIFTLQQPNCNLFLPWSVFIFYLLPASV